MFELTIEESNSLPTRSQTVTLNKSNRGSNTKYKPFVFTELYLMTTSSLSAELRELKAKVDLIQLKQEEDLGS